MIIRLVTSVGAAFPITFLLLLVMQFLIYAGNTQLDGAPTFEMPRIAVISPDTPSVRKNYRVAPPPPVRRTPPRRKRIHETTDAGPIPFEISPVLVQKNGPKLRLSMTDGELTPIVRVNPTYPIRAVTNGIEGFVLVEFTVNQTGSVSDARVVESTHRVFEDPAIDAVYRWRYKPRVINGTAINVTGVRTKLNFRFDD